MSILMAVEINTRCTSILLAVEIDTPCILLAVERDTPCTSVLLAVEGALHLHTAGEGKGIHPACPY